MRIQNFLHLVSRNMRMRRGRMLSARIGVGLAVFFLTLGLGMAFGVVRSLQPVLEKLFPEHRLIVRPPALNLSLVRFQTRNITESDLASFRSVHGVSRVDPQMPIAFPLHAEGHLAPMQDDIVTEIVIHGVPRELVADAIPGDEPFDWTFDSSGPCPAVISSYFLDLYNLGIAESNRLPKLNENALVGKTFTLVLGQSVIVPGLAEGKTRRATCAVAGFTRDPNLAGVAIPLSAARAFNQWEGGPDYAAKYNLVQIEVSSAADLDVVAQSIRDKGFNVAAPGKAAEQWRWAMRGGVALALALGLGVLLIALGNVVNTFALTLVERREEIGLLQALGASRGLVRRFYLAEIAWTGLTAAIAGILPALIVSWLATRFVAQWTSGLATVAELSFVPSWALLGATLVGVVLLSLVVTWPVVTRATHRTPAQLLRDQ